MQKQLRIGVERLWLLLGGGLNTNQPTKPRHGIDIDVLSRDIV